MFVSEEMSPSSSNEASAEDQAGMLARIGDVAKWTAPIVGTAAAELTGRPNFFEGEDLTISQRFGVNVAKFAMNRVHERIQARAA